MDFFDLHTHHDPARPGVRAIQSIFFDEKKGENNFRTAKIGPNPPLFSLGIHPWHLPVDLEKAMQWLRFEAAQDDVLAIGEAGLDHLKVSGFQFRVSRGETQNSKPETQNLQEQAEAFMACARLAEELEKPLIIHCVRANDEVLTFKKMLKPAQPWIIHGFAGHPNTAKQLVANGLWLSFGHAILQNEKAVVALAAMPADRFFLETDTRSDLLIEDVFEAAAKIRGCSVEWLQGQIWANFSGTFGQFAASFL